MNIRYKVYMKQYNKYKYNVVIAIFFSPHFSGNKA